MQNPQQDGVHLHRVLNPTPTGKECIAVIWRDETFEGEAPNVSGMWLTSRSGKKEIKGIFSAVIDPACFPLLRPLGTLGWTLGIKAKLDLLTPSPTAEEIAHEDGEMAIAEEENEDNQMEVDVVQDNQLQMATDHEVESDNMDIEDVQSLPSDADAIDLRNEELEEGEIPDEDDEALPEQQGELPTGLKNSIISLILFRRSNPWR